MTQGDLSVEDHRKKSKIATDALRDVGQPVLEATPTLNLLHSIKPRFSTTANFIAGQKDMTFSTALDQLALKELRLANEDKVVVSTALIASTASCSSTCHSYLTPSGSSSTPSSSSSQQQQQPPSQCSKKNRRNSGNHVMHPPFPVGPWICFNPWAAQGAWQASNQSAGSRAGPSGSDKACSILAHTAFAPSQFSQVSAPSWDQAGIIAALQQMSVQGSALRVRDIGAATHMHSSEGYCSLIPLRHILLLLQAMALVLLSHLLVCLFFLP